MVVLSYMILIICILCLKVWDPCKENASVKYFFSQNIFFTDSLVLTFIVCNWWGFLWEEIIPYVMGSKGCLINWLKFWWSYVRSCLLYKENIAVLSVHIAMYEGFITKRIKKNREISLCFFFLIYVMYRDNYFHEP